MYFYLPHWPRVLGVSLSFVTSRPQDSPLTKRASTTSWWWKLPWFIKRWTSLHLNSWQNEGISADCFFTAVSNLLSITLKQQEPNLIDGVVSWFRQSQHFFIIMLNVNGNAIVSTAMLLFQRQSCCFIGNAVFSTAMLLFQRKFCCFKGNAVVLTAMLLFQWQCCCFNDNAVFSTALLLFQQQCSNFNKNDIVSKAILCINKVVLKTSSCDNWWIWVQ